MQNGSPNGKPEIGGNVTPEYKGKCQYNSNFRGRRSHYTEEQQFTRLNNNATDHDAPGEPPPKRRKFTGGSESSTPRPPSPPWKRVGIDGPTSFVKDGRRRSTRTNVLPLELQPHSDKRHTRSAKKGHTNPTASGRERWRETSHLAPSKSNLNGERSNTVNGYDGSSRRREPLGSSNSSKAAVRQEPKLHTSGKYISTGSRTQLPASTSKSRSAVRQRPPGGAIRRKSDPSRSPSPTFPVKGRMLEGAHTIGNSDVYHESEPERQRLPRLRFKVKMPFLGIQNPSQVLPARKHSSFRDWLEKDTTFEDQMISTKESAFQEYRTRRKIYEAAEPNQVLGKDRCSLYLTDPEEEPARQYFHRDHFLSHALYFKKLLDKEHKHHRNLAKLLAHSCADVWKKRNKCPEDVIKEQQDEMRQKRRQLSKDLQRMFDSVRVEVDKLKLARWELERKAEDQLALNDAIKKSTLLFEKRRDDRAGIEDERSGATSLDGADSFTDSDGTEHESNMSSQSSGSEDEGDGDEALSSEALQAKYAGILSDDNDRENINSTGISSPSSQKTYVRQPSNIKLSPHAKIDQAQPLLDELDPILLDDSDESTNMDDDMGSSDENGFASGYSDVEDEEGNQNSGLLGFFSHKEFASDDLENDDGVSVKPTKGYNSDEDIDEEVHLVPNTLSTDSDIDALPSTLENASPQVSEHNLRRSSLRSTGAIDSRSVSPVEKIHRELTIAKSPQQPTAMKTPVPHLLRGTLREYQHFGLDWLAGLYNSNINGILADEMGLGKTIQTIALLAHLAVEHGVWGPHLVIVPTSVMLNWEMEFKKWCPGFKILTYYGSQEERRNKRKGWMDDDRWHVCITSYQLVLQDQQVFRRRNWHYMVLDEAHNIKNFRSQRWQTLLTFKTQARLLLTGTPLQNNLTELWSLLFFLMPSGENGDGVEGFADLRNFCEWFRRPVEQILEHGRETMDEEAKKVVSKLHTILRPYILRRLKVDVEKQMPAKYEHVVTCRLSKRQRYLYDGFMSRAQTKETLASGNYLSIINCLMQLRKVCNHPDLFETRPVTTSFAMSNSVLAKFETRELLIRRRLLADVPNRVNLDFMNITPISWAQPPKRLVDNTNRVIAQKLLQILQERQYNRINWNLDFDGTLVGSALWCMENEARKTRMEELERCLYFERHNQHPIYGRNLLDLLTINTCTKPKQVPPRRLFAEWCSNQSSILDNMILSIEQRSRAIQPSVQKFVCVTPAAVVRGVAAAALTPIKSRHLKQFHQAPSYDPFHEAQTRLSIAFPDKRLLQYDCGKLQQLDKLLRNLQAGGHRALIFTQMTKMLDILEQFLNIHGHRYLRLDGATKIEQRQLLTERFNSDNRILAFILSSRSGGLGINLTGADTVIFYDLDWNPAMDKQCQDRCHRIGQTRDVHIYRFVSEYTIESNILRKANQKRMLDDVVIQEGEFTTDYLEKMDAGGILGAGEDGLAANNDEASAAMDRVLDTKIHGASRVFEQAEDKEDIDAAKTAEKELKHVDDEDFDTNTPRTREATPGTTQPGEYEHLDTPRLDSPSPNNNIDMAVQIGHIDDYLLRFMEWNVKDEPLSLPLQKAGKRSRRGRDYKLKRHR